MLIDKGADIHKQGEHYGNALRAAAYGGKKGIIELLLGLGAELHCENFGGALEAGSQNNHPEVVKMLLENGAYRDINSIECRYGTIANMFAFNGYTDLLRFAVQRNNANVHHTDSHNRTLLYLAARGGHEDTFHYLVGQGLVFTTSDAKGKGFISYAASGRSLEFLSAVLEQGLKLPFRPGHWSPLHWACRVADAKVVELLFVEGWKCVQGEWTPLSIAVFYGNRDMLASLSENARAYLVWETSMLTLKGASMVVHSVTDASM